MDSVARGNLKAYASKDTVRKYSQDLELQEPERRILSLLRSTLPQMGMLDIGVGAGRTSVHFAPLVQHYVGIDYASQMISASRSALISLERKPILQVSDVRALPFRANSFDLILFSYNGIDYMSREDRLRALEEVNRVGKKNSYFIFSSHNLNSTQHLFSLHLTGAFFHRELVRWLLLRALNFSFLSKNKNLDFAVINDGANRFRLRTYYVRPLFQLTELADLDFSVFHLYGLQAGRDLTTSELTGTSPTDPWIYYVCKNVKR